MLLEIEEQASERMHRRMQESVKTCSNDPMYSMEFVLRFLTGLIILAMFVKIKTPGY